MKQTAMNLKIIGGGIVKKGLLMEPCWLKESWKGGVKQS